MKDFLKMTVATLLGLAIFGVVSTFFFFSMVGAIASLGQSKPVMPREGVLKIDMSEIILTEQTTEADPMSLIQGGGTAPAPIGIYDAVRAINAAAGDPAIKFIYLRPDAASGGLSKMEEFRTALKNFRNSGKAIVSYIENPTNAGYYLASVSDKIYMCSYQGGMNMLSGISTQLIFLKDILDKIGVNVQLIRHGKYKSAGEMYIRNSPSAENLEQNREMVSSVWNSWAKDIAQAREISVEDFNKLLDNLELNFPEDFAEKGLVDEVLTKEELRDRLANLYLTDNYRNIHLVSFKDYSALVSASASNLTGSVAVIYADGEIVDGRDDMAVAGDRFVKILSEVRADPSIKAVVLRVNSPGGSVMASEKIKNEIDLIMQSKPVIASYGDYAASGGYWISSNCTKIFSNATTLTGSIGVFSMIPDFGKAVNDKLHVNVTSVGSNKHSDMYSLVRPLDAKETAFMQAGVEKVYDKFTSIVSKGRNMTVEEVDAIAQGRVWSGADAICIGLVDEIGTLEDAINYAALSIDGVSDSSDVSIVSYPKPATTLEMLMSAFSSTSEPEIFNGTPLEGVEKAFRSWNASESGKVYARMPYIFDFR